MVDASTGVVVVGVVAVVGGVGGGGADLDGGDGADDGGTSSLFDGFDESSGMEEEEGRRVSKYSSMLWTYASVTRVGSVSSVGSIEYEMALG